MDVLPAGVNELLARLESISTGVDTVEYGKQKEGLTAKEQENTAKIFLANTPPFMKARIAGRFLNVGEYNVESAAKKLLVTMHFRQKQNIDRMVLFQSQIPLRGYDEKAICGTLQLPYVDNIWAFSPLDEAVSMERQFNSVPYYNTSYSELYDLDENCEERFKIDVPNGTASGEPDKESEDLFSSSRLHSIKRVGVAISSLRNATARLLGDYSPLGLFDSADARERQEESASDSTAPHGRIKTVAAEDGLNLIRAITQDVASVEETVDDEPLEVRLHEKLPAPMEVCSGNASGDPLKRDPLNYHGLLHPIVASVTHRVPIGVHYWDKEGRPVLYVCIGSLDRTVLEQLERIGPDSTGSEALLVLLNVYIFEVMAQLVHYNSLRSDADNRMRDVFVPAGSDNSVASSILPRRIAVTNTVVVIDCDGLSVSRKVFDQLVAHIRKLLILGQRHYPCTLHHIYVINCRRAVRYAYIALRSFISDKTKRKITFCSARSTRATLLKVIDSDVLPPFAGGSCRCPGGCVPAYPSRYSPDASATSSPSHSASQTTRRSSKKKRDRKKADGGFAVVGPSTGEMPLTQSTTKIEIRGGKRKSLNFIMLTGAQITWEFTVKGEERLVFSAVFIPATGDGEILSVVDGKKVSEGARKYVASTAGTLLLQWANSSKRRAQKTVMVKIYKEQST